MMIIWRIWHNHNEMTHNKLCPSIEGFRRFLISYLESLFLIKQHPTGDIAKGKMVVDSYAGFKARTIQQADRRKERKHWRVPDIGYMKLNTDGAFVSSREAGMGMVLRDHHGVVVAAACREAIQCRDATDAELMAIEEGVHLALLWNTLPIVVETDCAEAIDLIRESTPNTSIYAFRVSSIRELLKERNIKLDKVSRDANVASHELAKIGRIEHRSAVWFVDLPLAVSRAIVQDCNPSVN
jgi:ribonuclease HI